MASTAKSDKTTTAAEPAVEAPAVPEKAKKGETLFVAYQPDAEPAGFENVIIFGRKIDAAEYALDQSPAWKVIEIRKGVPLRAAVDAKIGQRG